MVDNRNTGRAVGPAVLDPRLRRRAERASLINRWLGFNYVPLVQQFQRTPLTTGIPVVFDYQPAEWRTYLLTLVLLPQLSRVGNTRRHQTTKTPLP